MSKTPSVMSKEERRYRSRYNKVEVKAVIMNALEELNDLAAIGEGYRQDLTDEYADSKPIYEKLRIVADNVMKLGQKLEDKMDEYENAPGAPKSVRGPLKAGQKRKDAEESGTESDSESEGQQRIVDLSARRRLA